MRFLIYEWLPDINEKFLWYLKKHNISLLNTESQYDKKQIDWLIIRTKTQANKDFLKSFPNLKYILRLWVGLDNIDIQECEKKWVKIVNTPWANSGAVADITIRWILSLLRKTYLKSVQISDRFLFMWNELSSQVVWIVWYWKIWRLVYQRLCSFWVKKFIVFDPYIKNIEDEFVIKTHDKNEIIKKSDIICLHLPLNNETINFIWKAEFEKLKSNAKIINCSRWWIVDEKLLYNFLLLNKNWWAYFDVWESEPSYNENIKKLLNLENFILSPHIWAMTQEAYKNMHIFNMDNL